MYAHRQIYENIEATISVPPELQHRKTEVIFLPLDNELSNNPIQKEGLGTLAARLFSQVALDDEASHDNGKKLGLGEVMASFFKDIPAASCPEEEFVLPAREHYAPTVTFDE